MELKIEFKGDFGERKNKLGSILRNNNNNNKIMIMIMIMKR